MDKDTAVASSKWVEDQVRAAERSIAAKISQDIEALQDTTGHAVVGVYVNIFNPETLNGSGPGKGQVADLEVNYAGPFE